MRFFGGLSVEKTSAALEISSQTVTWDWNLARVWLARELSRQSELEVISSCLPPSSR